MKNRLSQSYLSSFVLRSSDNYSRFVMAPKENALADLPDSVDLEDLLSYSEPVPGVSGM